MTKDARNIVARGLTKSDRGSEISVAGHRYEILDVNWLGKDIHLDLRVKLDLDQMEPVTVFDE